MQNFDVFLSHNSVDKPWVIKLKDDLQQYGISVWLDKDEIRPGDLFAKALENGLINSNAVALVISPESMASGWVEVEYYRALSIAQNKQRALQLIPIMLRDADLPGFLQDRNWVDFRDSGHYSESVWKLVWGISGQKPPKILKMDASPLSPRVTSESKTESNPVTTIFETPYGTMNPSSVFYVERPADLDGWNQIRQSQAISISIQAPRQMGKSSLLRRLSERAKREINIETVSINFEKFTEASLANEEEFLIEFCLMISDALDVNEQIDSYWASKRRSNIVKCSNYISQYVIPKYGQSFILAMDEIEKVLATPLRNDFFGMLRTWHNDRAWNESFAKLTLILSNSTEPHLFIDNPNQSPFNVAYPLFLDDFGKSEVQDLNRRYGNPLTPTQLDQLMELISGHPFLTRLSLHLMASKLLEFDLLLKNATRETGPFGEHLRRYWKYILDIPEAWIGLKQICNHQSHPENKLYFRLKGAGLIKSSGDQVIMRNELYARFFSERLND